MAASGDRGPPPEDKSPDINLDIQNFSTAMADKKWDAAFDVVSKAGPAYLWMRLLFPKMSGPDFSDNECLFLCLCFIKADIDDPCFPSIIRNKLIALEKRGNPIAQFILGREAARWPWPTTGAFFVALRLFKNAAEQNFSQAKTQLQILVEGKASLFIYQPEEIEFNFFSWLRKSTVIDSTMKEEIAVRIYRTGSIRDIFQPSPSITFYAALILLKNNAADDDFSYLRIMYQQLAGCITSSDQRLIFHKLLRQETPAVARKALNLLPVEIKNHVVERETAFCGVFYHILDQKKCSITRHSQLPASLINHILSFSTPIPLIYPHATEIHITTLKRKVAEGKQRPQTMLSPSTFFRRAEFPSLDQLWSSLCDDHNITMMNVLSHARTKLAPDKQVQLDDALLSILATIPRRGLVSYEPEQHLERVKNGIAAMLNTRTSPLSIALLSAESPATPARPWYAVMFTTNSAPASLYSDVRDAFNAISKKFAAKKDTDEEKKNAEVARRPQLSIVC